MAEPNRCKHRVLIDTFNCVDCQREREASDEDTARQRDANSADAMTTLRAKEILLALPLNAQGKSAVQTLIRIADEREEGQLTRLFDAREKVVDGAISHVRRWSAEHGIDCAALIAEIEALRK